MESSRVIDILNQARRAFDLLPQVEIMDEWEFDRALNEWYLHINIEIGYETEYFPRKSQWYVVVQSNYPKGKIKVYPDIENSITVTLYHQANNSRIERNGLWRSGALCLERNTVSNFQEEPISVDERLLYHVKRAINWLELAAKGQLVSSKEPFELPDFTLTDRFDLRFIFSEDQTTFTQWKSAYCRYGFAQLDVYGDNHRLYYVKQFNTLDEKIVHRVHWGNNFSKHIFRLRLKLYGYY